VKKKKQERLKAEAFWNKFRHLYARMPAHITEIPAYIPHVRCRGAEIDDDELGLLVDVVKAIDLLDLDDTPITCQGIKHLARLEELKELRLKECLYIDDSCLPYLNQLTSLELLHLGGTAVTLHGLTSLGALTRLRCVLVSSNEAEAVIWEKVRQAAALLPQCEFVVNYKVYDPYP